MKDGNASTSVGREALLSRRTVLRGALAAQAAWLAPAVVALTPDPALAGSSPPTTVVRPGSQVRGRGGGDHGRGLDPGGGGDDVARRAAPSASQEDTAVLASTGGPSGLLTGLGAGAVAAGAAAVARSRRARGIPQARDAADRMP